MGEIIERIPHKSVAYAFLEVRASSANEFESLRAEALKRAPHYGFAAAAPAAPVPEAKSTAGLTTAELAAKEVAAAVDTAEVTPSGVAEGAPVEAPSAPAAAAPSESTEGLSPREKAKAKMAAKKGA